VEPSHLTLCQASGYWLTIGRLFPVAQSEHISTLCRTKEVVQYTEGMRAWSVIVADYQTDVHTVWIADDATLGFMGTCLVRLLTVVT